MLMVVVMIGDSMTVSSIDKLKNRCKLAFGTRLVKWRQPYFEGRMVDTITFSRRAVITSGVTHAAHGARSIDVVSWLKEENLWAYCSDWEKKFLCNPKSKPSELNEASWQIERLWIFAWAKGDIDTINHQKRCGVGLSLYFPRPGDRTQSFIQDTTLRNENDIFKEHCLLSYLTEVINKHGSAPNNYEEGVVVERWHALNWLMSFDDKWPDSLWK